VAFDVQVTGLKEIASAFEKSKGAVRDAMATGVWAVAQNTLTRAKQKVPVDTGALRSSGTVDPATPPKAGQLVEITAGFGGPAAPYAIVVHERTDIAHREGEAKFLETALQEELAGPAWETIARITEERLGKGGR
jgi:hypothetical protein